MDSLNDFRPSDQESAAVAGMPEQIAIGYIRAGRRIHAGRRPISDPPKNDFGDLFNLFGGSDV